jgi:hypothetical protein
VAYLLGFFLCMIAVVAAAVGTLIGMSNVSTSERMGTQYPPAVVERNVTATHRKPRLFMVVPETKDGMVVTETKDGSPAKNIEASSAVAQDEKAEANKSKPHRHKAIARLRNNYARPSYWNVPGYAENGQKRFFNW